MGCGCSSSFSGGSKNLNIAGNADCEGLITQPEYGLGGCTFSHLQAGTGNCVFNCNGAERTLNPKKGALNKKCSCGRNSGGDCQCNKSNASGMRSKKIDRAKLKNRFNSFMGKSTNVNMRKHNIPMEDFAAYSNRKFSSFSALTNRRQSSDLGFGANQNSINRNDLNVEF